MKTKLALLATVLALTCVPARAQIPAAGALGSRNMAWFSGAANPGGNGLDLFERLQPDDSVRRYAVAATYTYGFDIVDITDPATPVTVGRYVTPGVNYHPWVQVNPRRNIVAISIEDPGVSPAHGISNGIEFVDITDVTAPARLGVASGLGGPHTIRMIGDNHVYTTLPTFIIDYTDPRNPVNLGQNDICGHEFFEDHNVPGRTYAGICGNFKWAILDTSDPANPVLVGEFRDLDVQFAHEVFPVPGTSLVGVADFRQGMTNLQCPGGGIHFYDVAGATPVRKGAWFQPFGGASADPNSTAPNWGSCTTHSWHTPPDRAIVAAGLYTAGTWVMDPTAATQPGGLYQEWSGRPGRGLGPTTWGSTLGNFLAEGDFVNASQWLPFDDPSLERYVLTNGLVRGLDVLRYDGPLPPKVARLRLDPPAADGSITGLLDRYAMLTHEGWVNKPLAAETVTLTSGTSRVAVVTGADGSFTAAFRLGAGSHPVTVSWGGNAAYGAATASQTVVL